MNKIIIFLVLLFNVFAIIYLVSPTPTLKALPNSVRSNLPGDTTQLQNVTGYYTNLSRTEVMNFYQSIYTSPFLIRLNHPPEKAKEIFRDTMQSYYIEEFIIPFKESLFVNGYEWEKDVFTKPEKRIQNKLIYNNITYPSKINTKIIPTSIPKRLATLFLIEAGIGAIFFCYRQFLKQR